MCFNITSSLIMTIIGVALSVYCYYKINFLVAFGIFYFTLMEIIHVLGYLVINNCGNKLNSSLAYVNYIHISFQPFIFTIMIFGLLQFYNLTDIKYSNFKYVIILSFIASLFMLSRLWGKPGLGCNLCGPKPCVKSGKHHITIQTPLRTKPEYFTPTFFIHFLFFFIPICFLGAWGIGISAFILISFILLINILGVSPTEGSTIWCLASIAQFLFVIIFVTLFGNKANKK